MTDRPLDYDEQPEVLFVFTDETTDGQQQQDTPLHATNPPQTDPPPTPHVESADQSFWAAVYTLEPPHTLMGVLTDLHIHRFLLHQHLSTHTALTETPIGHEPITDTLPPPIQRIIAVYHSNLQRAQHHTRLALNALDALARFPPATYFTDPHLFPSDHHSQPTSDNPTVPRRYPLPATTGSGNTFQHATTQTNPAWVSVLDNPIQAPHFDQSQQTTPRPATHGRHIQTDIHAIIQFPAFAAIPTTPPTEQLPSSSGAAPTTFDTATPTPTAAANKQPHERWQYVNLIPTPTVTPPAPSDQPIDFPSAIGGAPRNSKRSKTPPRTTTPPRVRYPDPRTGSPNPKSRATTHSAPPQPTPAAPPVPKRPPPSLYQSQPTFHPTQPVPSASQWSTFQGETSTPHPSATTPTPHQPPHAWPAHYPVARQPAQHHIPPQHAAPAAATTTTPILLPLPRAYYDEQGRPLPAHLQPYDPDNDPWMAGNH